MSRRIEPKPVRLLDGSGAGGSQSSSHDPSVLSLSTPFRAIDPSLIANFRAKPSRTNRSTIGRSSSSSVKLSNSQARRGSLDPLAGQHPDFFDCSDASAELAVLQRALAKLIRHLHEIFGR